jgi:hypothetical protein
MGEGGQGTGRGIAESAEGREQDRQEDVNPLIGFALAHAEQATLHHLERIGLEVGENKEQSALIMASATSVSHIPGGSI